MFGQTEKQREKIFMKYLEIFRKIVREIFMRYLKIFREIFMKYLEIFIEIEREIFMKLITIPAVIVAKRRRFEC